MQAFINIITMLLGMWTQKTMEKKSKKLQEKPQIHGSTIVRPVTKDTKETVSFASQNSSEPECVGEREVYGGVLPVGKKRVQCPYCGAVNVVLEGTTKPCACYFCWKIL